MILKEPSTWGGIGVLLQALRFFVPPVYQPIIDAISGVAGAAAVAMREQKVGAQPAPGQSGSAG